MITTKRFNLTSTLRKLPVPAKLTSLQRTHPTQTHHLVRRETVKMTDLASTLRKTFNPTDFAITLRKEDQLRA